MSYAFDKILSNQMNRSEALKLLKNKPLDDLSLNKEINYVCNKLDISRSELNNFFNLKRKSFHDYKSNFFLINFFTKILNFLKSSVSFGQPNEPNGHSEAENQVSSTSSSCFKALSSRL